MHFLLVWLFFAARKTVEHWASSFSVAILAKFPWCSGISQSAEKYSAIADISSRKIIFS